MARLCSRFLWCILKEDFTKKYRSACIVKVHMELLEGNDKERMNEEIDSRCVWFSCALLCCSFKLLLLLQEKVLFHFISSKNSFGV